MAAKLKFEIVTPEGVNRSGEVDWVVLPSAEGQIGIYPEHTPLFTQLVPGELIVHADGQTRHAAIGEGFAEITGDHVYVMTDMAVRAENIDEALAEQARKAAEERLKQKLSDEDFATVQAALMKSNAQIEVKRRRRV